MTAKIEQVPQSIETERAVLGAMIVSADCLGLGLAALQAEDFFLDRHRRLFTTIQTLVTQGQAVSMLTASAHLDLADPDVKAWYTGLVEDAFTATAHTIEPYLQIVRDCAVKRAMLALGVDLQHAAQNGATPDVLFALVEERLDRADCGRPARPEALEVDDDGDRLVFTWPGSPVRIEVGAVRDGSEGASAEVAVHYHARQLQWARLNLTSSQMREQFAKRLTIPGVEWRRLLDAVCYRAVQTRRHGTPAQPLKGTPFIGERFLIEPFVWHSDVSFLFADGGSGKGWVGLLTCLVGTTGRRFAGIHAHGRGLKVLYLDWESSHEDLDDRLYRLGLGLGIETADLPIVRLGMDRPLAQDLPRVRAEVAKLGADFLVLDSWMPACGVGRDSSGADTSVSAFQAMRSLARPALAIAHVSKVMADQKTQSRIYGSVFNHNLSRNAWEVKKGEGSDATLLLGLYHTKYNAIAKQEAFGLHFHFDGQTGPVTVSATRLSATSSPDLTARLSVPERIKLLLSPGHLTTEELADALGLDEHKLPGLRARLGELHRKGQVVRIGEAGTGRGHPTTWGLPTRQEGEP